MTLYDSSFLIDYLHGEPEPVEYAETHATDQAKTIHLVSYEVYLGELHKSGEPDFDAVSAALDWVTVVNYQSTQTSRHAAELMARLHDAGAPLGTIDGYITAAAWEMNETLATRDADFDTPAVREEIDVDLV